jgi:hypothetical protein
VKKLGFAVSLLCLGAFLWERPSGTLQQISSLRDRPGISSIAIFKETTLNFEDPHTHSTKRQCSKYAVAFWGYLRGSMFTSQLWQHFVLNTVRMPPMDAFWHGPSEIWEWAPQGQQNSGNAVTEVFLRNLLGISLRGFGTHKVDMNSFEMILQQHNITENFVVTDTQGASAHQRASHSLQAITDITHSIKLVTDYVDTHCEQPYTHVLVSRMDLLLYGYPSLPISPPHMVVYNEGIGYDARDGGSVKRLFSGAPQYNAQTNRVDPTLPRFNDEMIWVPWEIIKKMKGANVEVLKWWEDRSVSPHLSTSIYQLLKKLGGAQSILPYDLVSSSIYTGPGEREQFHGQYPEIPYAHENFIDLQSNGWIDHENRYKCPISESS